MATTPPLRRARGAYGALVGVDPAGIAVGSQVSADNPPAPGDVVPV